MPLHPIQEKILSAIRAGRAKDLSLRKIAELIGEDPRYPEKIRHHIAQLEKKGFLQFGYSSGTRVISNNNSINKELISIPIFGSANCGEANIFAQENIEGYLTVSKSLLKKDSNIFALRAKGDSMNRAKINGKSIEPGDYIIVDPSKKNPRDGDYVLSVIDDMANIKKFRFDRINNQIVLLSESTKDYSPIFISPEDKYLVNGEVIQVIKTPKA